MNRNQTKLHLSLFQIKYNEHRTCHGNSFSLASQPLTILDDPDLEIPASE